MKSTAANISKQSILLLSLVITFGLSGCGFHLKGNSSLQGSLESFGLSGSQQFSPAAVMIRQVGEHNGMAHDDTAAWSIDIINERYDERRLTATQSVSQDEFMLSLELVFKLVHRDADNDMTYGPIKVRRETIFQGNENQAASKENEKQLLIRELREQVAEQALRQTQIISANPPACECHHETESTATSE